MRQEVPSNHCKPAWNVANPASLYSTDESELQQSLAGLPQSCHSLTCGFFEVELVLCNQSEGIL